MGGVVNFTGNLIMGGLVNFPNLNDTSDASAKKLLYVIGSRARKNLHIISEKGRMTGYGQYKMERQPTEILNRLMFAYDPILDDI